MKCMMCDNDVSGRAKTCSAACRKKASRQGAPETPVQPVVEKGTQTTPHLTPTDQLFEDEKPNYYKLGDRTYDRTCLICKAKYQTRAELRRFCSPLCLSQIMIAIAGR